MKKSEGDAMKKDIEWLKAEIDNQAIIMDKGYIHRGDLMYLIDRLDEPEALTQDLPVIPKYVADWWERDGDSVTLYGGLQVKKKHKFDLVSIFHDKGLGDYLSRVEDWIDENKSMFLELVNGKPYEVEEEPMYYALVKGHELMGSNIKYWTIGIYQCGLRILERYVDQDLYSNKKTKFEWAELGVNDSNADFEEFDEELH